jgi:hypothetical protein
MGELMGELITQLSGELSTFKPDSSLYGNPPEPR